MMTSKVACPQCRAHLKTNQVLPVGKRVKCPKCGAHFSVGADTVSPAVTAVGVAPPPGNDTPLAGFPPLDVGRPRQALDYSSRQAALPEPSSSFAKTNVGLLVAIVVGSLIFLGGGVTLAVICLSGAKPTPDQETSAGDEDDTHDVGTDQNDSTPNKTVKPPNDSRKPPKKSGKSVEQPRRPQVSNADQTRVNEAIDRGAKYLRALQKDNGSWEDPEKQIKNFTVGLTAFSALTLLECGIAPDDPAIQKAATFIRAQEAPESTRPLYLTYDVSLAILFLDRLGDPVDRELIQKLAIRLVVNQKSSGGWGYYSKYAPSADEQRLLLSLLRKNQNAKLGDPLDLAPIDLSKLNEGGQPLPESLTKLAVWRSDIDSNANPERVVEESDNSNTQFAILGLWAAKKQDLPLQRTLTLIVKRFRRGQNEDGSWGYLLNGQEMAEGAKYPTMTCAGLLGLAVGMGLTNEARSAKGQPRTAAGLDPRIKKALAVVARNISDPGKTWGPRAKLIDLYFLWSVERVAVIYNLPRLGGMDWYGWGAEKIVASQTPKGNWENGGYSHSVPIADTCFALLFLKRANLAKDLTSKLQLGD